MAWSNHVKVPKTLAISDKEPLILKSWNYTPDIRTTTTNDIPLLAVEISQLFPKRNGSWAIARPHVRLIPINTLIYEVILLLSQPVYPIQFICVVDWPWSRNCDFNEHIRPSWLIDIDAMQGGNIASSIGVQIPVDNDRIISPFILEKDNVCVVLVAKVSVHHPLDVFYVFFEVIVVEWFSHNGEIDESVQLLVGNTWTSVVGETKRSFWGNSQAIWWWNFPAKDDSYQEATKK